MCDLTNTIKPSFLSLISSLYGKWWPTKKNWLLGKDSFNFISVTQTTSILPYTFLSKSPKLIFRYDKITLLRCEYRKRFKVTLIFSLYSGLVVDASIKEAPFTCSTCLAHSSSYNLTPALSRVLLGQHLIFCSHTWSKCCNAPRKCTPVTYKARQKDGFPVLTWTTS